MLRVREGAVRAACLSGRPCARCVSWIWVTFRPGSWSTWLHRSAPGRAPPICSLSSPWPRYNGPFTNPARNIKEGRGAEERKRALKTPLDGGEKCQQNAVAALGPLGAGGGRDPSLCRGEMPPEGGSEMEPSVLLLQPSAACWECQREAAGWGWGKELWGWHGLLSPLTPRGTSAWVGGWMAPVLP